jgi:hypothetical protein
MGQGLIRYAHVTRGGRSKGVRLIEFDSLMKYIEGFTNPSLKAEVSSPVKEGQQF